MRAGRGLGLLLALAVIIAGGLGFAAWVWHDYNAPGPLTQSQTIVLPHGETSLALGERLADNGIVAHAWSFFLGRYLSGETRSLKAGEYAFAPAVSPADVVKLLETGHVVVHRLTVPEGLTSAEVMALVNEAPALDGKLDDIPAEGSLLPDTYFFVRGDERDSLILRMQRAMDKALADAWANRAPDVQLSSADDAQTLASIVEKETGKPDERAHIAGIYLNRLRLGMKLQADPTVIYALTDGGAKPLGRPLDHADLAFVSPFNTYLYAGLPPGPIANPGKAALQAVVRPDKTEDLYFVSAGTPGAGHRFARTLDEQNRNINLLRERPPAKPGEK